MILILGKAKSRRAPNLGYRGVESPRWFDVSPKNFARHWEWAHWAGTLLWWSCQSAVAHSCSLLNHPNSFCAEECSGMMQNLMQICCSTRSVILNAMATWYTCSLNGVCHPHWLVQWTHHRLHMGIPVHSPWLPGYMGVTQTILVTLTMAGLFLNRPHIFHIHNTTISTSASINTENNVLNEEIYFCLSKIKEFYIYNQDFWYPLPNCPSEMFYHIHITRL